MAPGFLCVETLPFPKFHDHDVTGPVDKSVNCIINGLHPEGLLEEKSAVTCAKDLNPVKLRAMKANRNIVRNRERIFRGFLVLRFIEHWLVRMKREKVGDLCGNSSLQSAKTVKSIVNHLPKLKQDAENLLKSEK